MKIDRETSLKIKKLASNMPEYVEPFKERKLIHKKDVVEHYGVTPEELKDQKEITTTEYTGKRLIDVKVHEKRMRNAYKDNPETGIREYMVKINTMKFKKPSLWRRIKHRLNAI